MPTRRDVRLAPLLVGLDEHVRGDLRVSGGVADDAGRGVAIHVVDIRFVHRPGVDLTLRAVVGVVDRPIVEAERLGRDVVVAGREPRLLGRADGRFARIGEERRDRGLHLRRGCDRRRVTGFDQVGIGGCDRGQLLSGRAGRSRRACFRLRRCGGGAVSCGVGFRGRIVVVAARDERRREHDGRCRESDRTKLHWPSV